MSKDENELMRGAELAMQGLFIVYLHAGDATLRARARAMMEEFWAWNERRGSQTAPSTRTALETDAVKVLDPPEDEG